VLPTGDQLLICPPPLALRVTAAGSLVRPHRIQSEAPSVVRLTALGAAAAEPDSAPASACCAKSPLKDTTNVIAATATLEDPPAAQERVEDVEYTDAPDRNNRECRDPASDLIMISSAIADVGWGAQR
jgi:uncharacterized membrane protein